MIFDIHANSLICPRSRPSGCGRGSRRPSAFINYGVRPIGALGGGLLAAAIGLRPALFVVAAAAAARRALARSASPTPRLREVPDGIASRRVRPGGSTISAWRSRTSTRRSTRTRGSSAPSSSTAHTVPDQGVEAAAVLVGDGPRRAARRRSARTRRSAASSRSAGPGMHHVAYEVADVRAALAGAGARGGAELIDEEPREGLFGLQVAFVHPDSVHGVLSEVVSRG